MPIGMLANWQPTIMGWCMLKTETEPVKIFTGLGQVIHRVPAISRLPKERIHGMMKLKTTTLAQVLELELLAILHRWCGMGQPGSGVVMQV